MSTLYIGMSEDAASAFVDGVHGTEIVPGAHVLEAVYGDDRIDAQDSRGLWGERHIPSRRGAGGHPHPNMPHLDMPMPWPVVVGYDGMPASDAGIAMKAEAGKWVPVARFDPPLSEEKQAAADKRAMSRYRDRCAEYAVMGSTGTSFVTSQIQP